MKESGRRWAGSGVGFWKKMGCPFNHLTATWAVPGAPADTSRRQLIPIWEHCMGWVLLSFTLAEASRAWYKQAGARVGTGSEHSGLGLQLGLFGLWYLFYALGSKKPKINPVEITTVPICTVMTKPTRLLLWLTGLPHLLGSLSPCTAASLVHLWEGLSFIIYSCL